jgi:hypothetical protein
MSPQCYTCPAGTPNPTGDLFTYEVNGVTYVACLDCAIKTDEIELGEDPTMTNRTVCTLIAVG